MLHGVAQLYRTPRCLGDTDNAVAGKQTRRPIPEPLSYETSQLNTARRCLWDDVEFFHVEVDPFLCQEPQRTRVKASGNGIWAVRVCDRLNVRPSVVDRGMHPCFAGGTRSKSARPECLYWNYDQIAGKQFVVITSGGSDEHLIAITNTDVADRSRHKTALIHEDRGSDHCSSGDFRGPLVGGEGRHAAMPGRIRRAGFLKFDVATGGLTGSIKAAAPNDAEVRSAGGVP
jgi:hypothetical protein